jgi:hypothetical protein
MNKKSIEKVKTSLQIEDLFAYGRYVSVCGDEKNLTKTNTFAQNLSYQQLPQLPHTHLPVSVCVHGVIRVQEHPDRGKHVVAHVQRPETQVRMQSIGRFRVIHGWMQINYRRPMREYHVKVRLLRSPRSRFRIFSVVKNRKTPLNSIKWIKF